MIKNNLNYPEFNFTPKFIMADNKDKSRGVLDENSRNTPHLYIKEEAIPNITIEGIDISSYAIENAKEEIKQFLRVGNAKELPYEDNSFDVVISINTIHNLEKILSAKALQEIQRVTRGKSFITVDAYRNEEEKEAMYAWNLTAKTIMSVDEWIAFFEEVGYTGDYYWFIP